MYDLVGMGSALLDFQIEVPEGVLEKLQVRKASMTLVEPSYQLQLLTRLREEFKLSHFDVSSGGSAVNTLAGFSNFGGSSLLIGKLGKDENGDIYQKDLKSCGVDFKGEFLEGRDTGTCLALITPDAERSMLTSLGAAVELGPDDLQKEAIASAKILYIEGYLWDSPTARQAALEAIQIAKQNQTKVAFSFSDAFCVDRHFDDFVGLAKDHVDILFCNESEANAAAKTKDVYLAFEEIRQWCESVFVSTGPKGALAASGKEKVEVATWDCKLVDKLGAGDLFAAGVLHGLVNQRGLKESAYLGCYAATRIIQQMSARLNERLKDKIEIAIQGPGNQAVA